MSVGVYRMFESIRLFVCLFVCSHNSKTNDPKVFKLGVGNDLGIPWKFYRFRIQRSKVKVTWSITTLHFELQSHFIHFS